jgi:serine/threonine protein kinase
VSPSSTQVGTMGYMAPEVSFGQRYDETCGVFSVGVLLPEREAASVAGATCSPSVCSCSSWPSGGYSATPPSSTRRRPGPRHSSTRTARLCEGGAVILPRPILVYMENTLIGNGNGSSALQNRAWTLNLLSHALYNSSVICHTKQTGGLFKTVPRPGAIVDVDAFFEAQRARLAEPAAGCAQLALDRRFRNRAIKYASTILSF